MKKSCVPEVVSQLGLIGGLNSDIVMAIVNLRATRCDDQQAFR